MWAERVEFHVAAAAAERPFACFADGTAEIADVGRFDGYVDGPTQAAVGAQSGGNRR